MSKKLKELQQKLQKNLQRAAKVAEKNTVKNKYGQVVYDPKDE